MVANCFAQSPAPPGQREVLEPDEILVSTAALRDLAGRRNPDRIFLRDTTQVRGSATGPFNSMYLQDVPEEAKADFDSRNQHPAKVAAGTIQSSLDLKLLSQEEEKKLAQQGGACEPKAPIAFLSRPGLNSKRDTALLYVGTACYDSEDSSFVLLKKSRGEWVVAGHLAESHTIIDHFPPPQPPPPRVVEPQIESVRRRDAGNEYLLDVSFLAPEVSGEAFNYVSVYGMRMVEGRRSDDKDYLYLRGQWKPNDRVEFSVHVPKESTDPEKGWNLTFCVGSTTPNPAQPGSLTQKCYPSANVLTRIPQDDKAQPN